jgi:tRNA pseudouridine13 synthase
LFLRYAEGIGGKVLSPEDFLVDEIIDRKFLRKFERSSSGVSKVKGPYTLYLLKKRNYTTSSAIEKISKRLKIDRKLIGYAGLKDKFAVTKQYVTIKKYFPETVLDEISITPVSKTNRHIYIGDLVGNRFLIKLHGCKNTKNIEKLIDSAGENGLPNYFGPQRFGKHENNHIVGRMILKRNFKRSLKIINEIYGKNFSSINEVEKQKIKFFINAYQSFVFNKALCAYVRNNKSSFFKHVNIVGYDTRLPSNKIDKIEESLIKKDDIRQKDFSIKELGITCNGSMRNAFTKIHDVSYKISNNIVELSFTLPKGSYATILLKYLECS